MSALPGGYGQSFAGSIEPTDRQTVNTHVTVPDISQTHLSNGNHGVNRPL